MKFSITIPTFKIHFLHEAIASCLSQTYCDYEVIVVDDASPEDIQSVINDFDDSRLRFYRNKKNCGAVDVVDNWNICLGYCTGDYVICMGDDDMLAPNCLEEYARLIEKYPGLGVYHTQTDIIDERGIIIDHQRHRPEFQSCLELILHRWQGDFKFIGDFCFDVAMLRKEGGYYKLPLAWASDDITAVRAAEYKGIANTQTSTFLYRYNSLSITQSKRNGIKLHAKCKERDWYSSFFTRNTDAIRKSGTDKDKEALNDLLSHVFFEYFYVQIELHLVQYLEESLWNIFPALLMSRQLQRSKTSIFRLWRWIAKKKIQNKKST